MKEQRIHSSTTTPEPATQRRPKAIDAGNSTFASRSEPASEPNAIASHAIRMICVDDHAMLLAGLTAQFAIEGKIEVVGRLSSAAHLIDEVERLRPTAVLMDIEMPGPDAFEVADRLTRAYPDVRVIVLSAHIRDAYISASFSAGIDAYFAKSDELTDIVNGIYEVVTSPPGTFILGPKVREQCRPVMAGGAADTGAAKGARGRKGMVGSNGDAPVTLLSSLSAREAEILRLIGKGLSRTQIAAQLCRSVKTVDGHQDRMMKKLGIEARADLIRFAIREGLAQA